MGSSHPLKTFEPLRRAHPKAEEKENGREDQGERIVLSRRTRPLSYSIELSYPDGTCLWPQPWLATVSVVRNPNWFCLRLFPSFLSPLQQYCRTVPPRRRRDERTKAMLSLTMTAAEKQTDQQTVRPTKRPPSLLSPPAVPRPPALRSPSANRSHVVTMNFSRSIAPSPKEEISPFPLGLEGIMVQRSHTVRLIDMSD